MNKNLIIAILTTIILSTVGLIEGKTTMQTEEDLVFLSKSCLSEHVDRVAGMVIKGRFSQNNFDQLCEYLQDKEFSSKRFAPSSVDFIAQRMKKDIYQGIPPKSIQEGENLDRFLDMILKKGEIYQHHLSLNVFLQECLANIGRALWY